MKRALWTLSIGWMLALSALAQEHGAAEAADHGDPWIWWKWANFLLLAVVLGYLIRKHAGPYFAGEKQAIERNLVEAAKTKRDADARAAEIDVRLSKLGGELERLRTEARAEMAAEGERIKSDTERQVSRLELQGEQEVELMTRAARQELKTATAELAIGLARDRIRGSLNHEVQGRLVEAFIHGLQQRRDNRSARA